MKCGSCIGKCIHTHILIYSYTHMACEVTSGDGRQQSSGVYSSSTPRTAVNTGRKYTMEEIRVMCM